MFIILRLIFLLVFKIFLTLRATRIGCNHNIETKLNIELRITILFSSIILFQTSCRHASTQILGDPTPGGREALVSPRVGLAAHEAAGGGGGRVREDHRADTMQDPIRVPSVLLLVDLAVFLLSFLCFFPFLLGSRPW